MQKRASVPGLTITALALLALSCAAPMVAQESLQPWADGQQFDQQAGQPQTNAGAKASQQSQPPQQPLTPEQKKEETHEERTGTSNDRLFWTLPNFLTVDYEGQYPTLTPGQKFTVVAKGSFDYIEYPWYAVLAGISQAENSEPGYGQGAAGYGKRYGAAFADGTIENFMTGAVLPTVLREDPRYYQLGRGGFRHRTVYAVSRIFVTRTDSGHAQFNFSEFLGSASAAAISTYSYHPSSDRTLSNTASVWGTQVGYDTITLVVKEFWPDIQRKFQKKKNAKSD
jgi:hypothetical protein